MGQIEGGGKTYPGFNGREKALHLLWEKMARKNGRKHKNKK
jgi:hypothetical protein